MRGGKQMCCAAHANRTAMEGDRLGLILQYIAIKVLYSQILYIAGVVGNGRAKGDPQCLDQ